MANSLWSKTGYFATAAEAVTNTDSNAAIGYVSLLGYTSTDIHARISAALSSAVSVAGFAATSVYSSGSKIVQLISPTDTLTDVSQPITFTWNIVSGASDYQIQVADNDSFISPIINDTTGGTASYETDILESNTTYYWRVRAAA